MSVSEAEIDALLALKSEELAFALKNLPVAELHALCDALWEKIRGKNLHGGQPRNDSSRSSLEFARLGLKIAETTGTKEMLSEAQSMMALPPPVPPWPYVPIRAASKSATVSI